MCNKIKFYCWYYTEHEAFATLNTHSVNSHPFIVGQDVEHVPVHVLSGLVKQTGTSIGETIASCLKSGPAGDVTSAPSAIADLSKVSLTLSHHSYEPHPFRGDKTDCAVSLVWTYV